MSTKVKRPHEAFSEALPENHKRFCATLSPSTPPALPATTPKDKPKRSRGVSDDDDDEDMPSCKKGCFALGGLTAFGCLMEDGPLEQLLQTLTNFDMLGDLCDEPHDIDKMDKTCPYIV
jgi:hypothetical protein